MRYLLAVDPGVTCLGWAWFYNEKLINCGICRAESLEEMIVYPFPWNSPELAVIERPTVYRRGGKGDPADLISIAIVAGAAARTAKAVRFVEPRTWKGSVPKKIHNKRVLDALHDETYGSEVDVWNTAAGPEPIYLLHNMIDAVGIGLYQLGRM